MAAAAPDASLLASSAAYVVVIHVAAPGALGTIVNSFFPKGGVVKQQSETFIGPGGKVEYANRLSRIGPELHAFLDGDPFLGKGFGTRVTGKASIADTAIILDDQWLGTLLETGVLGVLGWLSLFVLVIRRLGARAKLDRDSREDGFRSRWPPRSRRLPRRCCFSTPSPLTRQRSWLIPCSACRR